jgi:hypothetical protein
MQGTRLGIARDPKSYSSPCFTVITGSEMRLPLRASMS